MKKCLFVVLSSILLFSLPSCGGKDTVTEEPLQETEAAEDMPHRTGDEFIGISNKDISNLNVSFSDTIPEDVTGNWRLATISDDIEFLEYAASYYDNYFESDDETHFIINYTDNTITCITKYFDEFIFLAVSEHVEGEEDSAKKLQSGDFLNQYWIYLDNGDIEKIEE